MMHDWDPNGMAKVTAGNTRALDILNAVLAHNFQWRGLFEHLTTMRITGEKIVTAYERVCNCNIVEFAGRVYADDPSLVAGINDYVKRGMCGTITVPARTRADADKPHTFKLTVNKRVFHDEVTLMTVHTLQARIDDQKFAIDQRIHHEYMLSMSEPERYLAHINESMQRELGYAIMKYTMGEEQ